MRFAVSALALLLSAAAPTPVQIPPDIRRTIIDHFSTVLVIPQTAIWEFDSMGSYILGGTLVCGQVNYQDSLRHWVGKQPFYLVIKSGGRTGDGDILPTSAVEDPTGTKVGTYRKVCKPGQ